MQDNKHDYEQPQGLGLFFGIIENNKRPKILWSASTWYSELNTWDLLLKILAMKDKSTLEEVGWNFLPIVWETREGQEKVEIFALTKLFQIKGLGTAYLMLYHQSAEKLTYFLLQQEEQLAEVFQNILNSTHSLEQLSNEQLKQLRIHSQKYYEILSEL